METDKVSRFDRMKLLQDLIGWAEHLLKTRTLSIRTTTWETQESDEGRLLGVLLGRVRTVTHSSRSYDVDKDYSVPSNSLLSTQPKLIYEKIPGLKELTEKFFEESDELIKKGIEGFQKEFEDLDKL